MAGKLLVLHCDDKEDHPFHVWGKRNSKPRLCFGTPAQLAHVEKGRNNDD